MPSPVIQISSNYAMNHVENTDGSYEYQGSATGIQIAFLAVTTGSSTITVTLPALVPIAPSYAPIGTQSWTVTVRKVDSGSGAIKLVTPDGTEIDGVAGSTGITTPAGVQHSGFTVQPDTNSNWWVTGT